jgi:hypothetical protein
VKTYGASALDETAPFDYILYMKPSSQHYYSEAAATIARITESKSKGDAPFVIAPGLKRPSVRLTNSTSNTVLVETRRAYDRLVSSIGTAKAHALLSTLTADELTRSYSKGVVFYTRENTSSLPILHITPFVGSERRAISYSRLYTPKTGFVINV